MSRHGRRVGNSDRSIGRLFKHLPSLISGRQRVVQLSQFRLGLSDRDFVAFVERRIGQRGMQVSQLRLDILDSPGSDCISRSSL